MVNNFVVKLFKNPRCRAVFLTLSPLVLALTPLSAAIPQTVNYQGFLLSKITNLPVETPQDVKFVIYDAVSGGSSLFTESRCNVPVSKGRYEVEVGATSGGIPDSVFTSHSNLWLEIQVDPDGDCAGVYEAMAPRIHLQASPYAFNALYASTAAAATPVFAVDTIGTFPQSTYGAVTISSNLFVMGGISVGNISPGQKLSVAGMVESKGEVTCVADQTCGFKFPDGTVQYTALTNDLWRFNGNNAYSDNTGNLAIGESNANPLARLHISTAAGETGDVVLVTVGGSNVFRVNGLGQVTGSSYQGSGATLTGIVAKAGDTMTGQLTLAGSSLTVTSVNGISSPKITFVNNVIISSETSPTLGGGVRVSSNVYVVGFSSAAKYYGDGSSLTAVTTTDLTKVRLAGDTMTGQLTLLNSTLTVTGSAFSVAGSTFSIFGGSVAVGNLPTYPARLGVLGGILATSSITAQGGLYSGSLTLTQSVTASSASFSNSGPSNYSIDTASGIKVNAGVVDAPYFKGNGSLLTNLAGTVLKSGDTMTGNLLVSGSSITIISSGAAMTYALTVASAASVNNYGLAVTTTGKVGIQISNPSAPLEVNSNILISYGSGGTGTEAFANIFSNGGNSYLRWTDYGNFPANQGALGFIPGPNHDFVFRELGTTPGSGGTEVFRIRTDAMDSTTGSSWKFGIGTAAPLEKFHVATNMLVSTSAASPILFISTTTGMVSISTNTQTHTLSVNGGILAVSSITTQGGFFGDGSGLTNITQGGANIALSSVSARADSQYSAVVFTSNTYVSARLAVGNVFTPTADLHVRGVTTLDQKNSGDSVMLNFFPNVGGAAYINWSEGATPNKGSLGMPSGLRDLVFNINSSNEEVFRVKGNSAGVSGWQFGIGTPAPLASFHVATNLLVSTAATNPILFISTAQAAVGIWTNAPEERFNVASTMLVGSKAAPLIYASTATGFTGIGTAGPRAMLEVGDGNLLAAGTYNGAASLPVTGSGSRFMWLPSISAIRAGYAISTEWDTVGLYSTAFGYANSATGNSAVVSGGFGNAASGSYSAISGGHNNINQGADSVVSGGVSNYLVGDVSVIPGGRLNVVYSSVAFAGGYNNYLDITAVGTFVWGHDDNPAHLSGQFNTFKVTMPHVFLVDPADTYHYKVGIRTPSPQAALDVNGDAQFGAGVTKSTFTADGFWTPRSMISSDLQLLTPSAIGEVVRNSTINDLCISTGTALAGQWALVGSRGIGSCY